MRTPITVTVTASELRTIAAEEPAYLVLGCGKSTIPRVRSADDDAENWTLARVLMREHLPCEPAPGERWCVFVRGVAVSDLDSDPAVIAHRTILNFDRALTIARSVALDLSPDNVTAAVRSMLAAGAIE